MKLSSFFGLAASAGLLALTAACGSGYETVKVKDYRLAVLIQDATIQHQFATLIDDYNQYAGMRVLTYEPSASAANSAIVLTEGLQTRDGKVGWGQWMTSSKSENPLTKAPGDKAKRTVEFSMRVEFDADYMRKKTHVEQQKLFFHEVGHGLELDHNPADQTDVMYPDVSGDKDFPRYFEYVRRYMNDHG